MPTHVSLSLGETSLSETSTIQAEGIIKVPKTSLQEPRQKLRRLTIATKSNLFLNSIERTARCVPMAIRFPDLRTEQCTNPASHRVVIIDDEYANSWHAVTCTSSRAQQINFTQPIQDLAITVETPHARNNSLQRLHREHWRNQCHRQLCPVAVHFSQQQHHRISTGRQCTPARGAEYR